MKNKSLWYIAQDSCPSKYGYGTAHHYIGKELLKSDIKINIISSSYNHGFNKKKAVSNKLFHYEVIDEINYIWIKSFVYNKRNGFLRILNWLIFTFLILFIDKKKINKPDIIYFSSFSMIPIFTSIYLKLIYNSYLIVDIRDIWPLTLIEIGKKSKYNPLIMIIKFAEKLALKNADLITSTLPNYKQYLDENDIKTKVIILPQGIPYDIYNSKRKIKDKKILSELNNNYFKVCYSGSIGLSNNLENFFDAAIKLKDKKIKFFVLGDGDLKNHFIKKCKNNMNIIFIEKIKREYIYDFLSKCDLAYDSTMNKSIYKYGLSRQKWIDYLLSSLPIIVSFSGFRSIINECKCGKFIPSNSKEDLKKSILEFFNLDKSEIIKIGKRGNKYILDKRGFSNLVQPLISELK